MEKRKICSLRNNFSCFPQYFQYISKFKSPNAYIFVKCGCANYFFLNSAILIYRGTDISKYFRESLGIRDNESRLFLGIFKRFLLVITKMYVVYSLESPHCGDPKEYTQYIIAVDSRYLGLAYLE